MNNKQVYIDGQPLLISVLVITYNQRKYVTESLESVLNLSFDRIELVITDDASTDGTQKLIEDWIKVNGARFISVKVNFQTKNVGITKNVSSGLALCDGHLIKTLAGDDILTKNGLSEMVRLMDFGEDVISIGDQTFMDEGGHYLNRPALPLPADVAKFKASAGEQFELLLMSNWIPASATLFRKSAVLKFGLWSKGFPRMDDWPTWLLASKRGAKFRYLPIEVVVQRLHPSSTWHNTPALERLKQRVEIMRSCLDFNVLQISWSLLVWVLFRLRKRQVR